MAQQLQQDLATAGRTDADADVMTVAEFCRRHRLSRKSFYRRISEMPATFMVGARRYITREAAAQWRAERSAA